jgi:transcriptional regulator NrdR family protein
VRFASVYLDFKDVKEFLSELQELTKEPTPSPKPKTGARA